METPPLKVRIVENLPMERDRGLNPLDDEFIEARRIRAMALTVPSVVISLAMSGVIIRDDYRVRFHG